MLEPNFNPFPEIITKRLVLKKITETDIKEIFAIRSSTIVMQYIDRPLHKTIEDTKIYIEYITKLLDENEAINWGITLKDNPTLIGAICLFNLKKEHFRAEMGYLLLPEFQEKGIMKESIEAVINYGFHSMKLHSIEAHVDPNNTPSIKILEKNNFIREAYFKENYFCNGNFQDSAIYSLLSPIK